jgi:methionine-rich copper-binding protein CopC
MKPVSLVPRFIAAFFVLVLSQSLAAHTTLTTSHPADGAVVASPVEIKIEFPAPVRLTAVKLENEAGTEIELGTLPVDSATVFSVPLAETLAPGRYLVTWRSVSGDSHIVSGEIRFTVTD